MVDKEDMRIECVFKHPQFGPVACLIKIRDEVAVAKFSDVRLARQMYQAEKKLGNKNQKLVERISCLTEVYPGKSKEEIAKVIVDNFEKHNIEVLKHK